MCIFAVSSKTYILNKMASGANQILAAQLTVSNVIYVFRYVCILRMVLHICAGDICTINNHNMMPNAKPFIIEWSNQQHFLQRLCRHCWWDSYCRNSLNETCLPMINSSYITLAIFRFLICLWIFHRCSWQLLLQIGESICPPCDCAWKGHRWKTFFLLSVDLITALLLLAFISEISKKIRTNAAVVLQIRTFPPLSAGWFFSWWAYCQLSPQTKVSVVQLWAQVPSPPI